MSTFPVDVMVLIQRISSPGSPHSSGVRIKPSGKKQKKHSDYLLLWLSEDTLRAQGQCGLVPSGCASWTHGCEGFGRYQEGKAVSEGRHVDGTDQTAWK